MVVLCKKHEELRNAYRNLIDNLKECRGIDGTMF
jgi:hypothetical protein